LWAPEASVSEWTFLTNHGVVLLCLAADPGQRLRDVAAAVGVTERAVQRIVADLEEAGYLTRTRVGRRNRYELHPELPMRHPAQRHRQIGDLISLLGEAPRARRESSGAGPAERT
jgi:DNA-binding IclR family transcriptional regulator